MHENTSAMCMHTHIHTPTHTHTHTHTYTHRYIYLYIYIYIYIYIGLYICISYHEEWSLRQFEPSLRLQTTHYRNLEADNILKNEFQFPDETMSRDLYSKQILIIASNNGNSNDNNYDNNCDINYNYDYNNNNYYTS